MKLPWKRTYRRGAGILTVLVASSLLLMLAFTVAGTSFHHLSLSNRMQHSQQARNLAEAALAQAAAELLNNPDKYITSPPPAISLPPTNEYQRVYMTFNPTQVASINSELRSVRIEASLNNLNSENSAVSGSRTVPGQAAYLRAVGVDHGVERSVEAVIYIPKFPWSLASDGPIFCSGQTRIAAVKDLADAGNIDKEVPGHVATNANPTNPNEALVFQGNDVLVTGDAQSASGADFGNSTIRGERRLKSSQTKIPKINVAAYSTANATGVTTFTSNTPGADVSGMNYYSGGLHFASGLKLNGGVVYAEGDINIQGPIEGEGAIISRGAVNITGSGSLTGENKLAILAEKDVTLRGSSSDRMDLFGLIYSEGKISTQDVSFYGNGVSATGSSGTPGMELRDTTLVSAPVSVEVVSDEPPDFTQPPKFGYTDSSIQFPGAAIGVPFTFTIPFETKITRDPSTFFDSSSSEYVIRFQTDSAKDVDENSLPSGIYRNQEYPGPPKKIRQVPSPTGPPILTTNDLTLKFGTDTLLLSEPNFLQRAQDYSIEIVNADLASVGLPPLTEAQKTLLRNFVSYRMEPNAYLTGNTGVHPIMRGSINSFKPRKVFSLDFSADDPDQPAGSSFLALAEKIRVLYWREVP